MTTLTYEARIPDNYGWPPDAAGPPPPYRIIICPTHPADPNHGPWCWWVEEWTNPGGPGCYDRITETPEPMYGYAVTADKAKDDAQRAFDLYRQMLTRHEYRMSTGLRVIPVWPTP